MRILQYDPVYGAYTELFGGLSSEITVENSGAWLMPWGRIGRLRHDIEASGQEQKRGRKWHRRRALGVEREASGGFPLKLSQ